MFKLETDFHSVEKQNNYVLSHEKLTFGENSVKSIQWRPFLYETISRKFLANLLKE